MSFTSPESQFTPRREFIREQRPAPNSFSLLAIASSNFVRLYSFPIATVSALRRLFEQRRLLVNVREDVVQNFTEFALEGKPWASAKSINTERMLIEMMAIIYNHGYTYLSTIDYGREHDDRLAMAFSKPDSLASSSTSESPLFISPNHGSATSLTDKPTTKRVPFALSFPSATLLRVIAPPLHSTPAILQAVRGSWPRGVVSEKKVGDSCFEFKLKGYKWFQEDTFATDSLRHILSLLSSLDAHNFSLLASISLTNRSRVKDLWVFTGPAPSPTETLSLPESPAPSILNASHPDIKRTIQSPEPHNPLSPVQSTQSQPSQRHRKLATEPSPTPVYTQMSPHLRAATEGPRQPSSPLSTTPPHTSASVLRKPAPRAQIPVSVHDADVPEQPEYRLNLPSVIPDSVENLTGVGSGSYKTPDVFYSTSPFGSAEHSGEPSSPTAIVPVVPSPPRSASPPSRTGSPLKHASPPTHERTATPPRSPQAASFSPASSPEREPPVTRHERPNVYPVQGEASSSSDHRFNENASHTPPLLSPSAFRDFRDSAFSSSTDDATLDIPIKWTGLGRDSQTEAEPAFPGGWQPTPIEEKDEGPLEIALDQDKELASPVQDVGSRVSSPELTSPTAEQRKSEAGLLGVIAATVEAEPKGERKEQERVGSGGQGWVLVDVEGKPMADAQAVPVPTHSPEAVDTSSPVDGAVHEVSGSENTEATQPVPPSPPVAPNSAMSSAAKAIAIIDAVDAKSKSPTPAKPKVHTSKDVGSPSAMKRFFSLGRKDSVSSQQPDGAASKAADNAKATKEKEKEKPKRSGFLRRTGPPEAARNDKRRSIDG